MKLFQPIKEPDPPLDPQFESFRSRLAEASLNDEKVGHFSIRLQTWFTEVGPWWRRRWINPRWAVEWQLNYDEPFDGRFHRVGPPYDDGVELEHADALFEELAADTFMLQGDIYSLNWIDRNASPQLWRTQYAFFDPASAL